jgi:hypothetical protein
VQVCLQNHFISIEHMPGSEPTTSFIFNFFEKRLYCLIVILTYILFTVCKASPSSTSLSALLIFCLFGNSLWLERGGISLIYLFLGISFVCLPAICMSSDKKCLFRSIPIVYLGYLIFLLLSFWVPYILCKSRLCQIHSFSQSSSCLFKPWRLFPSLCRGF